MTLLLVLGHNLRNANQNLHRQQPYAVLIILGQMLEQRNHLASYQLSGHSLDEFCQVCSCLSSYHGGIIVYELGELRSKWILGARGWFWVWDRVETRRRDLWSKPIGFWKTNDKRNKIFFDLSLRQVIAYFVEWFDCLWYLSGLEYEAQLGWYAKEIKVEAS